MHASRNDQELHVLSTTVAAVNASSEHSPMGLTQPSGGGDVVIQSEISQLKSRLAGTDQELQKTNTTLRYIHLIATLLNKLLSKSSIYRRLGDEMRSMSIEKSRQREQELLLEMDRLQAEIKSLQKSSEEGANISQQLSQEVSY